MLVARLVGSRRGRVEAAVVPPVDPAGGGVLDVDQGLERALVEDVGGDGLGLISIRPLS